MSEAWQKISAEKRESINSRLPEHWKIGQAQLNPDDRDVANLPKNFLTKREIELTERLTAAQLIAGLQNGALTSLEVTEAFCHRATIAHQLVNCLSEVMFEEAVHRAKELDDYFRTYGKPVGPLHGLPVSLKDQFRVKGTETSVGYVAWLGKKETEDTESLLVKQLRKAGAVIFVKTNVPTSLMAIETNNNIIGYTTNPYNRLLSSGGSSGGEAALLALRGSIIGLGSDVGASIRVPAAFCGIYGLKPSHGRLPYLGVANSMEGHNTVPSVIGPMGHSISDLRLLTRFILESEPWLEDPKVIALPWNTTAEEEVKSRAKDGKLTFAILRTDSVVAPHPPVLRAVEETVLALKAQGYEVIEWEPPSHSEAFQLLWNTFAADGGRDIHNVLNASGEPPVPQLSVSYGEKFGALPTSNINELWELQTAIYNYQARYLAYWNSTGGITKSGRKVDAIIIPASPTASYRPKEGMYFGYTGVFNVLDFSAAVVPVTRVDKMVDLRREDFIAGSELDENVWKTYDPDTFHGAPVGVQVVGRRLEEEKVLALAEEVVAALDKSRR
ncbi:amidase signature domain-containing protein [Rhexocercosporidium sp. MPI-PUGE-AT-0058]|nr:amidase signature domain-containing protein [Rhexocercosporidium sp. MPI-PUGE-AT-0058]